MAHARVATECSVETADAVGVGAKVAECLSAAGVNLSGFCGYSGGGKAYFLAVADDSDKASAALKGAGYACECNQVVVASTTNRPGAMAEILRKVANAGVDVEYAYATAHGGEAICVVRASDAAKAAAALGG